jgi:transposase
MRFDLSDEDWALLEPLLPKSRKSARVDDRKIVNAIFYVLRTGMPWRDLARFSAKFWVAMACLFQVLIQASLQRISNTRIGGWN